jgi:hypothetical protein
VHSVPQSIPKTRISSSLLAEGAAELWKRVGECREEHRLPYPFSHRKLRREQLFRTGHPDDNLLASVAQ